MDLQITKYTDMEFADIGSLHPISSNLFVKEKTDIKEKTDS